MKPHESLQKLLKTTNIPTHTKLISDNIYYANIVFLIRSRLEV